MPRNLLPTLLILLLLIGLGGGAWLTHHPDAEIVRRAQEWPVVGPLARAFHTRFVPPPPPLPAPPRGPSEVMILTLPPDPAAPAPLVLPPAPADAHDSVWVVPGVELKQRPAADAKSLYTFESVANAALLERRGDWYRVHHRRREGWVHLPGYDETSKPPFGEDPEPPRPLPAREPEPQKLAAARELLGTTQRELPLGPYRLFTDSPDDELIAFLHPLAASLDDVYYRRHGRVPLGVPKEAVVLFAGEGGYRLLQLRTEKLLGLAAGGHNAHGVAALFIGKSSRGEVASTLLHELAHFVNRRALGPALPPWLDEGIADDLALSRIDHGKLWPGVLGGSEQRAGGKVEYEGGLASLLRLQEAIAAGQAPPLEELLQLDWEGFVRSPRSALYYAESAFWVRYLLDGEGGRFAPAWREFLTAVSEGRPPDPENLRERLGRTWPALEASFRAWVASRRVD